MKKSTSSVRFGFTSIKPKKSNQTEPKSKKTKLNQIKIKLNYKNQTKPEITKPKQKLITPTCNNLPPPKYCEGSRTGFTLSPVSQQLYIYNS